MITKKSRTRRYLRNKNAPLGSIINSFSHPSNFPKGYNPSQNPLCCGWLEWTVEAAPGQDPTLGQDLGQAGLQPQPNSSRDSSDFPAGDILTAHWNRMKKASALHCYLARFRKQRFPHASQKMSTTKYACVTNKTSTLHKNTNCLGNCLKLSFIKLHIVIGAIQYVKIRSLYRCAAG